jgi:membrane-associated PAP2 superfamily phosphatase
MGSGSGMNLRNAALAAIVAAAVIVGSVFALWPDLDLAIAGLFYDPATHTFPLAKNALIEGLRTASTVIVWCAAIAIPLATIWSWLMPSRALLPVNFRAVLFLVVTLALGPGLLVNGILKEHSARPRPGQVTQFGGTENFVPWWNMHGTCEKNCSFVSGEVSAAAWMLAPAVLAPGAWSVAAVVGALAFTIGTAFLRLAAGGHFFSDAAFALILTAFVIWIAYGLAFRAPRSKAKL